MTPFVRFLCAAVFFLFAAHPAAAATAIKTPKAQVSAAVRDMQRVYAGMDSFQANFAQNLVHRESGSVETRNGTLLFKKPLLVRWETAKPHAELLIINNREIWNYLPDEEIAYRYAPDLAQDSRTLIRVITGQARLDQDFYVEEDGKEDNLLRLRLYPLEPTQQMTEASIWLDPATKLIKKAVIVDFFGNSNEVSFVSMRPNIKLEERGFDFTPPKGVKVEDRRESGVKEQVFK